MMDSNVELFNMSVLNWNLKTYKHRWQDVEFWLGIWMKNVTKCKEMNEHAVRFGFRLTLLEVVDEAEAMVLVSLRE